MTFRDEAPGDHIAFSHLSESECWELLAATRLARLAVVRADGSPDIRPMNHLVHDGAIYLRTASDTKLTTIESEPRVALETDGDDEDSRWSVVVTGTAAQVTRESEIRRAGISHLDSWTPTSKRFVIKIIPSSITGRRFAKSAHAAGPAYAVPLTESARTAHAHTRSERPVQIPHYSLPARSPARDPADGEPAESARDPQ